MKPCNKRLSAAMPMIGFLLVAGSFVMKRLDINPIICAAISGGGCAWGLLGVFFLVIKRIRPEQAKQMEIDQKDERYVQIREKAGLVTYFVTLFTLMILELVFLILDMELACILTICAIISHLGSFFIALFYYDKKL